MCIKNIRLMCYLEYSMGLNSFFLILNGLLATTNRNTKDKITHMQTMIYRPSTSVCWNYIPAF